MVAKERGRPRTLTMVAFLVPEEEEVLLTEVLIKITHQVLDLVMDLL